MKQLIVTVFLFINVVMYGQTAAVYHEVFTKKDGLVIDVASSMVLDNDGFLWIGGSNLDAREIINTSKPLVIQRFNGNAFHNILLPIEENTIRNVAQMYKREDGQFYIICEGLDESVMLYLFNPSSTAFVKIPVDWKNATARNFSKLFSYKGEEYFLIQRDRALSVNKITASTEIKELFTFTTYENKFKIGQSTIFIPFEDKILIGDDNFPLTFLDWNGNVVHRYAADTFLRTRNIRTKKFWIEKHFSVNNREFAFIDDDFQLYEIHHEKKRVVTLDKPNTRLELPSIQVLNDAFGNHLVVGANEGNILFYTLEDSGFKKTYEASVLKGSPSFKLLAEDLSKDLWMATNRGELHYFKFPSEKVTHYLGDLGMRTIKEWDSERYIAASDAKGWYTINKNTQEVNKLFLKENGRAYSPNYTRNLFFEGDTIWSNSFGNILKINRKTLDSESYRHYPVACMIRPDDSTIVYGTHRYNLMSFNTNTKEHVALLKTDSLDIDGIELSNDKRTIVCATEKGILTYDRENKTHQLLGKDVLDDAFLLMMVKNPKGGYLFGSRKGDIYSYTLGGVPKKVYTDEQKAGIASILFDDNGQWWIYTFNGLVVFNPDHDSIQRFSIKDGLSHNEGNRHSALNTAEGMFFGTLEGLNFFKPTDLQPIEEKVHLELLRVRKFDPKINDYVESMDRYAFAKAKTITLPAENRVLELDFNLINTDVTREETYRYRLNEGEWVDLKSNPSIRFPNLESGDYNLEIQALDFSGKVLGKALVLEVIANSFFYKTWWFYLGLSLISVSLLGWMFYQQKLRSNMQVQFGQDLMNSQEKERTRIAKELHDSVGQQLTLIKQRAQQNDLPEMATLTNNTLEEVRAISRGLYPALLKQLGLTGSIEQLLLDVDEQSPMFVSIDLDDIDPYFNEESGLNFYRFIQENVANVMKHANAKTLAVSVELNGTMLRTEIRDNGDGFDTLEMMKSNSLGLKTLKERIKMLEGRLTLESEIGKGTVVTAEIPINK